MSTVGERAAEAAQKSRDVEPLIIRGLRQRKDPVSITAAVAEQVHVDRRTAYIWVRYVEEQFERSRRRVAIVGAVFLWVAVLLFAAAVVLPIVEINPELIEGIPAWTLLAILGAGCVPFAVLFGLFPRRLALRRGVRE